MGRFALMLLLLASSVVVSAQSLQDVRIVTADDPPYVQTENGRLSGGLVVTRLYRVLDKLGIPRSRIQVLPWSRCSGLIDPDTNIGGNVTPNKQRCS